MRLELASFGENTLARLAAGAGVTATIVASAASVASSEILKILKQVGFRKIRQRGSHVVLRHDELRRTVTVPHPKRDFAIKTLKSIEQQSGIGLATKAKK